MKANKKIFQIRVFVTSFGFLYLNVQKLNVLEASAVSFLASLGHLLILLVSRGPYLPSMLFFVVKLLHSNK